MVKVINNYKLRIYQNFKTSRLRANSSRSRYDRPLNVLDDLMQTVISKSLAIPEKRNRKERKEKVAEAE